MYFRVIVGIAVTHAIALPDIARAQDQRTAPALTATGISIDQALGAAQGNNIDVLTSRLSLATAQANLRIAKAAPNPVLSVNGVQMRPSRIGSLPFGEVADTVARIDLPLERGGKRQARTGSALASIAAAQGDLADAQRRIRAATAGAYFDLKAAEARLALQQGIAGDYATSERVAARRQKAGAISNGDLARQRVESLRAAADAAQAASDRRDAQLTLATLIGREGDAGALATTSDWPLPVPARAETAEALANRRPDVAAAQSRVDAARRDLAGAHALKHPDITVGVQYERADGALGVGDSMGVGVSLPIPVRNRYNGEVDAAGAALLQAEAVARKTRAIAVADVINARRAATEASARRELIVGTQLPAARKAADVAEFAYRNGALALLDLLDARRSLQAVELGAIDARTDEAKAIAALQAAESTGDE